MSGQPATDPYQHLRDAFDRMPIVATLGLRIVSIEPGQVTMAMPIHEGLCFRPGQVQATSLFAIADFAAVGAAATLLPEGWTNATIDTTLKLIRPGRGVQLQAHGWVIRPGRLLSVCAAEVFAIDGEDSVLCATFLATAHNIDPQTEHPARRPRRPARQRRLG